MQLSGEKENLSLDDDYLEKSILVKSLKNKSFFLRLKKYLFTSLKDSKSYFSEPKYQKIFNLICVFFERTNKLPSKGDITILMNGLLKKDQDQLNLMLYLLDEIYLFEDDVDEELLFGKTKEFIIKNRVYEVMFRGQSYIQTGDWDKLSTEMAEAVKVSFDVDFGVDLNDVDDGLQRILQRSNANFIPTSSLKLNETLDGGFREGELYVFGAMPGTGKTLIMGSLGLDAWTMQNKNILYYTFETSEDVLRQRLYQNLAGMSKRYIIENPDDASIVLKEKMINLNSKYKIIRKQANSTSSADILAQIQEMSLKVNFRPDILFIDYMLLTKANDARLDPGNSYRYYKSVSEDMRNISVELSIPVVSAAQLNRDSQDERGGSKMTVSSKNLSESRGILDTADYLAIVTQSMNDRKNGMINLFHEKVRNGKAGFSTKHAIDYEYMRITDAD